MTNRPVEKLTVFEVRPEDATTALQAARRADAQTVELRATADGMIELTISNAAEAEVRKALTPAKVLSAKVLEREAKAQRLTEVRPRSAARTNTRE